VEVLALVRVDLPIEDEADAQDDGQREERGQDSGSEPTHGEARA
jgi:hypothetical protein